MKLSEAVWGKFNLFDLGEIQLKYIRIGEGAKRIVILSGMHGDELSPHYVLNSLIKRVIPSDVTLDIIFNLNWAGILGNKRMFPYGDININRTFGNDNLCFPLKSLIDDFINFIHKSDLVIDLHNWDSPSAILGLIFGQNCNQNSLGMRFLNSFGCDFIWKINGDKDYQNTLGNFLLKKGIEYCALELPNQEYLSISDFNSLSQRLIDAISNNNVTKPVPVGRRKIILNKNIGMFLPLKNPGDKIYKGELIAEIVDIANISKSYEIYSDCDAIILHHEKKKVIYYDEIIFILGITE